MRSVNHKWLAIDLFAGRARTVSGVTNSEIPFELFHIFIVEDIIDHSHTLVNVE